MVAAFVYVNGCNPVVFMEWADHKNCIEMNQVPNILRDYLMMLTGRADGNIMLMSQTAGKSSLMEHPRNFEMVSFTLFNLQ